MQQAAKHITIREATIDDVSDVTEVFDAAFAPFRSIYRPIGKAAVHQAERAREGTRLIAQIEGSIVATVQFASHENHVHVIGLAVHPDFQRMGIARRMIEWIVARAPALGHNIVALDTIEETGNVPLFEKMGFQVVRQDVATWCVSDDFENVHDVVMERTVA